MLFTIKNRAGASLLLLAAFAVGAWAAREAFDLRWDLGIDRVRIAQIAIVVAAIGASDALLHGLLLLAFRERYLARYRALVEHFRPQRPREIAAGALLAGLGEEPIFRGVLLQGLMTVAGAPPAIAIGGSALAFGALHAARERKLWPFAVWAVWEGALLGIAYVASGSLAVTMAAHAAHDAAGFAWFAVQRRTGWLLGRPPA